MSCESPITVETKTPGPDGYFKADVPCGRCPECKRRRTSSWQFRLMQEDKISLCSHFVTLTYDTEFVPISDNGFPTLCKRDFQLFMKRLRKHFPGHKLKYYCAGEYGETRKRPHFHVILFNCTDPDKIIKEWYHGGVHIGDVTNNSVGYTAKYINKEKRIPEFLNDDRIKEFSLMSKGLGKNYVLSAAVQKYHQSDLERNFVTIEGGIKLPLPRYYREKLYTEEQRAEQRSYILAMQSEQYVKDAREYYKENPNGDYERHLEDAKIHRYKSFYHHSKHSRE